jgi:3-methyladenine DNA glycosylase AlkD
LEKTFKSASLKRVALRSGIQVADDPEWFIQKAIGWWLRELSKRDPKRVRQFLTDHGPKLRGVAKREATKYLKA